MHSIRSLDANPEKRKAKCGLLRAKRAVAVVVGWLAQWE